jgi:hypothetical protein
MGARKSMTDQEELASILTDLAATLQAAMTVFESRLAEAASRQRLATKELQTDSTEALMHLKAIVSEATTMRAAVQGLSTMVADQWKAEMTQAAGEAGQAQAIAFGEAAASAFEEKLKASRDYLEMAALITKRAVKGLRWKFIALESALAAGVVLGVAWLAWGWVPSLEEIRDRRTQVAALEAQSQKFAEAMKAVDVKRCREGDSRLCVRVELNAGRFGPNRDYVVAAK